MKKNSIIFFCLAILIFFYTRGLFNTYFQQDEWNGFGLVISLSHQPWWSWFGILGFYHVIPLSQFFWYILYRVFGYQAFYFALTAYLLHVVASFLVYQVSKRLSKNELVGILTAVLFATNGRASDAFTHLAVFPATVTCFIAMMAFILYLTKFTKENVITLKDTIVLLLIFLTAILLREDGFMLIPLLLCFFFVYNRKIFSKKNILFFVSFFALVVITFGMRIFIALHEPSTLVTTDDPHHIYLYNLVTFPFKLIVQSLVEIYYVLDYVVSHITLFYSSSSAIIPPPIINTVGTDFIILVLFNFIVVLFVFLTYKMKDTLLWKNISFGLLWILINAGLLAGVGRYMFVIEQRYLYHASFVTSFIISLIFVAVWQRKNGHWVLQLLRRLLMIGIVIFLLMTSYQELHAKMQIWQQWGQARQSIVKSLITLYPTIPHNTIFFVQCQGTCHRNSEFGLPNTVVLPFSSGPGWIFMLQYARQNEDAYAPFFATVNGKQFLWDYGTQGYEKKGDYGFGYFIDKKLLTETLKKNKLNKNIVIGLEYDESNFTFHDISKEVKREL
ncbi:MAG TPA: hypothetical protein VLF93_06780 [Candidatus Saccharimonadales bacterium]|nr:hypothetical protein [Candidatus Saccharimonadales bacterium]